MDEENEINFLVGSLMRELKELSNECLQCDQDGIPCSNYNCNSDCQICNQDMAKNHKN